MPRHSGRDKLADAAEEALLLTALDDERGHMVGMAVRPDEMSQ